MEHPRLRNHAASPHSAVRLIGNASETLGWLALGIFVIGIVISGVVALLPPSVRGARKWPTAQCQIVDSRVTWKPMEIQPSASALIMYDGEYKVRYTVDGREHFVWKFSGWSDADKDFIANKVSGLPQNCPFVVQYNPRNPDEAVVKRVE